MKKKNMKKRFIITTMILTLTFTIIGILLFMQFGGNNCDQPPLMTCDCFCCNMLGLRGYEACAGFGAYAGAAVGLIIGITAYLILRKK